MMTEIAGTGYYYGRSVDGSMTFSKMIGNDMKDLNAREFAAAFGFEVAAENARKEATKILDEVNDSTRTAYKLASLGGSRGKPDRRSPTPAQ